jgi:hypothetical protein
MAIGREKRSGIFRCCIGKLTGRREKRGWWPGRAERRLVVFLALGAVRSHALHGRNKLRRNEYY